MRRTAVRGLPVFSGRVVSALVVSALVVSALGAVACGSPAPRTEVMLVIDAEPAMRGQITSLHVTVLGGEASMGIETWGPRYDETLSGFEWPRRIALIPLEAEPPRGYRVEVEARDASGTVLTRTALRSTYVPQETRVLEMVLEDACLGVECTEQRCFEGRCVDPLVDIQASPQLDGGVSAM